MANTSGGFGEYLKGVIRDSGLSVREVAKGAGLDEGTIRAYIKGYVSRRGIQIPAPPTIPTVVKIADALGILRSEMLDAAQLEAPARVIAQQPPKGAPTIDQLFDMLRERFEQQGRITTARFDPEHILTDEQIDARGATIAALNQVALAARRAGDDDAADAVCELVEMMDNHLTAMTRNEVTQAQQGRRPARQQTDR